MAQPSPLSGGSLTRYREYLLLLARVHIGPRLRGALDPEEVVQAALVKAAEGLDQFHGDTEQERLAWLRAILANCLAEAVGVLDRRDGNADRTPEATLEESSLRIIRWLANGPLSSCDFAARDGQLMALAAALAKLPDDQRTVLELKHLRGCSLAEICGQTDRSKASVVGLLFRGMKRLRDSLDDQGRESGP
jgi:RNA polymerase sigma-70 factor (ECF subfamily)